LSLAYKDNYTSSYPASLYGESFEKLMFDIHNSYDNINIFLERPNKEHQNEGRFHDEQMSLDLDKKIMKILTDNDIPFIRLKVNEVTINSILALV
jgi:hypothetical protein